MKRTFKVGDHVTWNSEAGHVSGTIVKVHTEDVSYKGYTHHASQDEPQYLPPLSGLRPGRLIMRVHSKHARHSGHSHGPAVEAAGFVAPEVIARRAYELFQERGRQPGRDVEDWLRAERELKESKRRGPSE